jgi:hypothetical protein
VPKNLSRYKGLSNDSLHVRLFVFFPVRDYHYDFLKMKEHLLTAIHDCYSTCLYLEAFFSFLGPSTYHALATNDRLNIECWFTGNEILSTKLEL